MMRAKRMDWFGKTRVNMNIVHTTVKEEKNHSEIERFHGFAINAHHNASQLRMDLWRQLIQATKRLHVASQSGREFSQFEHSVNEFFRLLTPIEKFWDFPGKLLFRRLLQHFENHHFEALSREARYLGQILIDALYKNIPHEQILQKCCTQANHEKFDTSELQASKQRYFAVLFVGEYTAKEEQTLRKELKTLHQVDDDFTYELIFMPTFEDALIAVSFNHNIQVCVIGSHFALRSETPLQALSSYIHAIERLGTYEDASRGPELGETIRHLRPELDLYLLAEDSPEGLYHVSTDLFRRIFHDAKNYIGIHTAILQGIQKRYKTPFFDALKAYSRKPTDAFHALPISNTSSISKSQWIEELGEFYGNNIFMAETSGTQGGLDSLLQPKGPLKEAQEAASRAFGSQQTFFVTNGTSTANKIVLQAHVRPGDTVLLSRDCHKSHHYGMVLSGGNALYINPHINTKHGISGTIPLKDIKSKLLELKARGHLHEVRMLVLTNCTFDGLVYNCYQFMEEILAIKPDMIFLWDEAWWSFARCVPVYRQRTAMHAAKMLAKKYSSASYRREYEEWKEAFHSLEPGPQNWTRIRLLPDPDKVKIRVYATHSTHKSLSCFRQGSMIHVYDQEFNRKAKASFTEAYMTHTSTSPNYQILASMDMARRQVELEGFKLVQESIEHALTFRRHIKSHPLLSKYFSCLGADELLPKGRRSRSRENSSDWEIVDRSWRNDEFVVDPTRITLDISKTGMNGMDFRSKILMERFGIQVNKTSLNTVLLLMNIGTTRGAVGHLLKSLIAFAEELEHKVASFGFAEERMHQLSIKKLTVEMPELPEFSQFHICFQKHPHSIEGNLREAFYLAYDTENIEYLDLCSIEEQLNQGRELVSSTFVTPYPPGFPVLVPGQVLTQDILEYIHALGDTEIHGMHPQLGLQFFTRQTLDELAVDKGIQFWNSPTMMDLPDVSRDLNT